MIDFISHGEVLVCEFHCNSCKPHRIRRKIDLTTFIFADVLVVIGGFPEMTLLFYPNLSAFVRYSHIAISFAINRKYP